MYLAYKILVYITSANLTQAKKIRKLFYKEFIKYHKLSIIYCALIIYTLDTLWGLAPIYLDLSLYLIFDTKLLASELIK